MNYSEYLRRKMEQMPVVYGPSKPGDESMRIMMARYRASVRPRPAAVSVLRDPTCCRGQTPVWRSGGGRPDAGPYVRAGDGQQQEWSSEFVAASAAGCAVCVAGKAGYVYKECCAPEPTVEAPRDLSQKREAYIGTVTCCPVVGPPLQELAPDCSCAVEPGRMDTLAANNLPSNEIPYLVPEEACTRCGVLIPECECGEC